MPVIALLSAIAVVAFQKVIEWQYGTMGIVGLLFLSIGLKARNHTCSSIGAVILALVFAGPAL
ncbi:hypothetical protein Sipo8835_44970 [Streptomyces ipomoeae]|jgi:hypothetical protein|uniref:Uncharacterized protein n=1 Tax=Streptomyces ipomoeae TaxID=103232 RepID=A0A540PCC7_9ACTN|nr:hypothetical protein [Streptomyces ipomoeae]MDX2826828.1 hypothetical protein [Streptomyces ipomoeae]MDX2878502.1 hypothetical protein [Streptomyces ipomoeae]MDX2937997.1 hypothetical protein [Streptomyces ipomoeae]TQE15619.1 hypothetical protein Sipo8835_44970 [Streptomyces ipomoeae]TQE20473.1 hypothetical protein Sipo7851_42640 [Streptomyces ipomoeae]